MIERGKRNTSRSKHQEEKSHLMDIYVFRDENHIFSRLFSRLLLLRLSLYPLHSGRLQTMRIKSYSCRCMTSVFR